VEAQVNLGMPSVAVGLKGWVQGYAGDGAHEISIVDIFGEGSVRCRGPRSGPFYILRAP
jgi:hypothetical protein